MLCHVKVWDVESPKKLIGISDTPWIFPFTYWSVLSSLARIILPQAAYCYRSPHASRALQLLLERGNNQQKW